MILRTGLPFQRGEDFTDNNIVMGISETKRTLVIEGLGIFFDERLLREMSGGEVSIVGDINEIGQREEREEEDDAPSPSNRVTVLQ